MLIIMRSGRFVNRFLLDIIIFHKKTHRQGYLPMCSSIVYMDKDGDSRWSSYGDQRKKLSWIWSFTLRISFWSMETAFSTSRSSSARMVAR